MQISKELLSKVLGYEIAEILPFNKDDNFIEYTRFPISTDAGIWEDLNIYELAHKCKEWAKNKGYNILSGYDSSDTPEALVDHTYSEGGCYCTESFKAETEPEAIFKACQWILDNVKTNSLS